MGVSHQLTTIGGMTLARASIGLKICIPAFILRLLKAHMDLNGIQRLYGLMERKCLDNKFQILTNI